MPGAAACAVAVSNKATAAITTGSSFIIEITGFVVVGFIAVLLIDVYFGHQPAEVLCIV